MQLKSGLNLHEYINAEYLCLQLPLPRTLSPTRTTITTNTVNLPSLEIETMSSLQYFDYEGFGENSKKHINYSQAVRIDNRIEISGQGPHLPFPLSILVH
jgi:enamine deaminase RidA (YjgF/YER057c/UK114 family)